MGRFIKQFSTLAALMLTFVAWGCDNIGQSTGPDVGLSPSGYAVFHSASGKKVVAVRERAEMGTVSATIGKSGGSLTLGRHTLRVPRDAVSEPTEFTMSRQDGDLIRLRLSATRGETFNNVGSQGFAKPVRLEISYERGTDLPQNFDGLVVVYFKPDGTVEEQVTLNQAKGRKAIGLLDHFSDFGLAWPI